MKTRPIKWQEQRRGECGGWELFDIIAERDATDRTGWAFYEKTSWDLTWIRIPATLCRLAKALIEEDRLKSGTRYTSFYVPMTHGLQHNPERVCGLNGKRSQRRGCCRPQVGVYVPPAHVDRRMGHSSRVHRALRVAKWLLEPQGVECESRTAIEAGEPLLCPAEDDSQPPLPGRRGRCPGGF